MGCIPFLVGRPQFGVHSSVVGMTVELYISLGGRQSVEDTSASMPLCTNTRTTSCGHPVCTDPRLSSISRNICSRAKSLRVVRILYPGDASSSFRHGVSCQGRVNWFLNDRLPNFQSKLAIITASSTTTPMTTPMITTTTATLTELGVR